MPSVKHRHIDFKEGWKLTSIACDEWLLTHKHTHFTEALKLIIIVSDGWSK